MQPASPAAVTGSLNYALIHSRAALDRLVNTFWDAESVCVALADSTPSETDAQHVHLITKRPQCWRSQPLPGLRRSWT